LASPKQSLQTLRALTDSTPNRDSLSTEVDAAIRQKMTEQHIPGLSLAVACDGKTIKATGYGLANLDDLTPIFRSHLEPKQGVSRILRRRS
jgi:CubicO group peptidase (beta-lactamase class C family)